MIVTVKFECELEKENHIPTLEELEEALREELAMIIPINEDSYKENTVYINQIFVENIDAGTLISE